MCCGCTKTLSWGLFFLIAVSTMGCANNAQTGALVGGAGGAAVGAGIGSLSHARAGEGALIGAAVGAIGGYVVGNEMDKAEQRERDQAMRASTREPGYYSPSTPPQRTTSSSSQVTKQDVVQWTQGGVKDEIIIDRIQRSGTVFHITAADENYLRDAGVGEEVMRAMKNTARR